MTELKVEIEKAGIPWLENRTIILGPTGSYAHGTNIETSDHDYSGICVPPMEYYIGLESFNEYNTSGGKAYKNTKDDVDVKIAHINKFVRDAMTGHPNSIDLLFLRPEDYIKVTPLGQKLLDNRHLFLSQAIKGKFCGFANGQTQAMKKSGYQPKTFALILMLLDSAREILETGDYHAYKRNREFLIECRMGKYSEEEAFKLIDHFDSLLKIATEKTELPYSPDFHKINTLLMEINLAAIGGTL